MNTAILNPAIALVTWTLLIWLLMYARRIPAMQAAGIEPIPLSPHHANHPFLCHPITLTTHSTVTPSR